MQMLSKGFQCIYPYLTYFVSQELPLTKQKYPYQYRIYEKYCGSPHFAEQGVTWNEGPILAVVDIRKNEKGEVEVGDYDLNIPDRITLNTIVIDKFNSDSDWLQYFIGMQYLLLHELIHWARNMMRLPADVEKVHGQRPGEAGDEFEFEAYGQDMSDVWKAGIEGSGFWGSYRIPLPPKVTKYLK